MSGVRLIRYIAWFILFVAIGLSSWAGAILVGWLDAPNDVNAVMHDTYYTQQSILLFLKSAPFIIGSVAVCFWVTRSRAPTSQWSLVVAIIATIGAGLILLGAYLLSLHNLAFDVMPRRYSDADISAIETHHRLNTYALYLGIFLSSAALIGSLRKSRINQIFD